MRPADSEKESKSRRQSQTVRNSGISAKDKLFSNTLCQCPSSHRHPRKNSVPSPGPTTWPKEGRETCPRPHGSPRKRALEWWRKQKPQTHSAKEPVEACKAETQSLIGTAFNKLPLEQRTLLWLREVEGQSYTELASSPLPGRWRSPNSGRRILNQEEREGVPHLLRFFKRCAPLRLFSVVGAT